MLVDSADRVGDAMAGGDERFLEWKLDGASIEVRASEGRVAVYTGNLNDVTSATPAGREGAS